MPLQRPAQLAWPYLNPNSPLYQGLVFAGLGPHPGGYDFHDCSPYKNNGLLTNMDPPTDWVWSPELGRWATKHDRTADIDRVMLPNIRISGPCTVSAFVNADTYAYADGGEAVLNHSDSGTDACDYNLYVFTESPNNRKPFFGWGSYGNSGITATNLVTAQTWNHLVGRRSGVTGSWTAGIFVDGTKEETSVAGNPNGGASSLTAIGALPLFLHAKYLFDGLISDVCIWSRALADSEISALADPSNAMLSGLILPPRRKVWGTAVAPLTLPSYPDVENASPFDQDESIETVVATGGQVPYSYQIISQTLQ